MIGEEDGLLHNKLILENNEVVYMAGGNGGDSAKYIKELEEKNETMAAKESANG
jgi:hypothetical protein